MMIQSVFQDEQELLKSLIEVHLGDMGIHIDPMYYKGNFYKQISKPFHRFDINPQDDDTFQADARHLPLGNNYACNMILDPPFMIATRKTQREYYSSKTHTYYNSFDELEKSYKDLLKEAYRVLKPNAILIFKCQDYTDSKTLMNHCYVWKWAMEIGFYPKDLAILWLPKNKVYNPNLIQRHLRKTHSYFWVFQKKNALVSNSSSDKSESFNKDQTQ